MHQRLQNDDLARLLHQQLYARMIAFCEQYTPEVPASAVVTTWLTRFYNGDNNLHILVSLDTQYQIRGHAIVDITEAYGHKVVYCYQASADKGYTSTLDEGIEYVNKLAETVDAACTIFVVTKHIKGLEKKYGYQIARTMMVKHRGNVDE